ncbi:MAG: carboxypeptidase-like regulatory domain-containing protein [Kineosporiaceae bacterium]
MPDLRSRAGLGLIALLAVTGTLGVAPAHAADVDDAIALRVTVSAQPPATAPTDVCLDVYDVPGGTVLTRECVPDGQTVVDVPRAPLSGHAQVYVLAHGTGVAATPYESAAYPDTWVGFRRDVDTQHAAAVAVPASGAAQAAVEFPAESDPLWFWLWRTVAKPTQGVRIDLVTPNGDAPPQVLYSAEVGDNGADFVKVYPGQWWPRYVDGGVVQYRPGISEDVFRRTVPAPLKRPGAQYELIVENDMIDRFVVAGQVYDAVDDKPVAGACVYPHALPTQAPQRPWDGTGCPYAADGQVVDAEGRYRFVLPIEAALRGEPPVLSAIDVSGRHRRGEVRSRQDGFRRGTDEILDLGLARTAALQGKVVGADGRPVAGACPWWGPGADDDAHHLRRCSDATGWWSAGELDDDIAARGRVPLLLKAPAGAGVADAYVPGVPTAAAAAKLAVTPGRRVTAPVTTLRGVTTVSGHVRDASGRALAKLQVGLRAKVGSPRWTVSTVTDADGAYRLTVPAAAGGVVEVEDPAGHWATAFGAGAADPALAVPLPAGPEVTQDVVVSPAAAVRLSLRVAGVPVDRPELVVQAYAASGAPLGARAVVTREALLSQDGAVAVLAGLPAAPTFVRIAEPDGGTARQWWYRAPRDRTRTPVTLTAGTTTPLSLVRAW